MPTGGSSKFIQLFTNFKPYNSILDYGFLPVADFTNLLTSEIFKGEKNGGKSTKRAKMTKNLAETVGK